MKTALEKAEAWLSVNVAGWSDVQLLSLAKLIKEQDSDTRHACAEAWLRLQRRCQRHVSKAQLCTRCLHES